jgi:hypothetical protein
MAETAAAFIARVRVWCGGAQAAGEGPIGRLRLLETLLICTVAGPPARGWVAAGGFRLDIRQEDRLACLPTFIGGSPTRTDGRDVSGSSLLGWYKRGGSGSAESIIQHQRS